MKIAAVALTSAAVATSLSGAAQQPFRSRVAGVRIDAIVTADHGRPVEGLAASDFDVLDNGIRQRFELAASSSRIDATVLLDVSYSVVHDRKFASLVRAGGALLAELQKDDSVGLVAFSKGVYLLSEPTVDHDAVRRVLDAMPSAAPVRRFDSTALWDAVFAGASLVVGSARHPYVCILSDGADNASWLFTNEPSDAAAMKRQRDRTLEVLRNAGVTMDLIWVPRDRETWNGRDNVYGHLSPMEEAGALGGAALSASDAHMTDKLAARLNQIRSAYVLTFEPSGPPTPGWHTVNVRLKNRKGRVQARPGYYVSTQ